MNRLLACAALALVACGAPGQGAHDLAEVTAVTEEPSAPSCGMTFDPAQELAEATLRAAARWSAATGCDVRVEHGGIPLVAWERLFVEYTDDGHALLADINHGGTMRPICGLATWAEDEAAVRIIDVSLACDVPDAVAHEMGHALARLKRHSLTGVMASGENEARTHAIDDGSLELVCYSLPCAEFDPEVSP